MKKNIFAFLALLGMLGFVSCDMANKGTDTIDDTVEPQQQEEEYFEVDEFETVDPAIEDQQRQEDEGLLDSESGTDMRDSMDEGSSEESDY